MKRAILVGLALALALPMVGEGQSIRVNTAPGAVELIYNVQPDTTTTGTSEECLWSGSVLIQPGQQIEFLAQTEHAANTNNASQTVRIGQNACASNTSMSAAAGAASGGHHGHLVLCSRVNTTLVCYRKHYAGANGTGLVAAELQLFVSGLNFSNPVTFGVTGTTGTQAGDITLRVVKMWRY